MHLVRIMLKPIAPKPRVWLTPKQIARLRDLREQGLTVYALAKRFNISVSAVSRIARYERRVAA